MDNRLYHKMMGEERPPKAVRRQCRKAGGFLEHQDSINKDKRFKDLGKQYAGYTDRSLQSHGDSGWGNLNKLTDAMDMAGNFLPGMGSIIETGVSSALKGVGALGRYFNDKRHNDYFESKYHDYQNKLKDLENTRKQEDAAMEARNNKQIADIQAYNDGPAMKKRMDANFAKYGSLPDPTTRKAPPINPIRGHTPEEVQKALKERDAKRALEAKNTPPEPQQDLMSQIPSNEEQQQQYQPQYQSIYGDDQW